MLSPDNPTGVTYRDKKCSDDSIFSTNVSVGQTITRNECVKFGGFKISGKTIGDVDVCFTQQEIIDALNGTGVISKAISDFTQDPAILVGQFNFKISECQ